MSGSRSMDTQTTTVESAIAHGVRLLFDDPTMASVQAQAVLDVVPGHPKAVLLLGQALRLIGNFGKAESLLIQLAKERPRSVLTRFELARVHMDRGDYGSAIAALNAVLALAPNHAEALLELGFAHASIGHDVLAEEAYRAALQASAQGSHMVEAALALCDERLEDAERLLCARLVQMPRDIAALRMLAELGSRLGRYDEAVSFLERALALHPGFLEARANLAQVLLRQGRAAEALAEADHPRVRQVGHAGLRMIKAAALARLGRFEEAVNVYEALLLERPNEPLAWMSYGHALKTVGRQADAVEAYRRVLAIRPDLGEAWWSLANLKTMRFSESDVAAMLKALALTDIGVTDRLHLQFSLGKAFEDAQDDQRAFENYAAANALRRGQLAYSPDRLRSEVDDTILAMQSLPVDEKSSGGCLAPDPIFILGMPRAGSTLIEQILASHNLVEGTMELPDIPAMVQRLKQSHSGLPMNGILSKLSASERLELGQEYIQRTCAQRQTGRPFFIDKMPNNWLHVAFIQAILPRATIIDARRHPLACCWSIFRQHFARGQGFSYDLAELGAYYRDYVRLMASFDKVAPGRVIRVFHEALVADPDREIRLLLNRVGLSFDESCLSFWQTERAVRTASSEQVRQPIFTTGLDQWRRFDRWLGPLRTALGSVLELYPQEPEAF